MKKKAKEKRTSTLSWYHRSEVEELAAEIAQMQDS